MEWIVHVWFNCGEETKLNETKFIEIGPLSRYSKLNVTALGLGRALFSWSAETWTKDYQHEMKMMGQKRLGILEEETQRLEMFGWSYHLRSAHLALKGFRGLTSHHDREKCICKGYP